MKKMCYGSDMEKKLTLCYYKCLVTKNNKTKEYGYGLPWKDVRKEVQKHYNEGADAVELEMITEEEFNERLPKPY